MTFEGAEASRVFIAILTRRSLYPAYNKPESDSFQINFR